MKQSMLAIGALLAGALVIPTGISSQSPGKNSVTGEWEGSFTPSSRLGALRAKVDLTRDGGPVAQGQATSLAEANLTGVWNGAFDKIGPSGRVTPSPFHMSLRQEGTRLTGTVGPSEVEQVEIMNGRVEEEKIFFEAPHPPDGPNIQFSLELTDHHIHGTATLAPKEERIQGRPMHASFVQHGSEITGNIRLGQDQPVGIQKGKLDKNKILVEAADADVMINADVIINLELTLVNDSIKGDATLEHDGHLIRAKVDLKRQM